MVLLVVAILAAGLTVPLAAQVQMRRHEETRRILDEAREALLGFAAAHARLPCPASAASRGEESFAPGGDAGNGRCSHFHDGFLPAATLGLAPLDDEGFLRDAWGTRSQPRSLRRVRGGRGGERRGRSAHAGQRHAGRHAARASAPRAHFLFICASGAASSATSCGPAANQLTRRAAFVLLSARARRASTRRAREATRRATWMGIAVFVCARAHRGAGQRVRRHRDLGAGATSSRAAWWPRGACPERARCPSNLLNFIGAL